MAENKSIRQPHDPENPVSVKKPEKQQKEALGPITTSYRCPFCHKCFTSEALLMTHI